jgi:hypothetical protein
MANPDTLPSSADLTGPCPRCGRVSNFQLEQSHPLRFEQGRGDVETVRALRCMGCATGTVTIEVLADDGSWEPIHWYPAPVAGQLDPAVPPKIASCFDEGMRCLAIQANRAAVVMFRGALGEFVKEKGSSDAKAQRDLHRKLKKMEHEGTLHASLVEWAKEIRLLGNEGAHPDQYEEVTQAEAADLAALTRQLIKVEYEVPAQIVASRAARKTHP